MAILNLDFSSVDDGDLIPEGEYPVTIDKVEARPAGPNSKTGAANLNWTLTIASGDHRNRKVWLTTSTAPNALWKLKEVLKNLGVYEENMKLATDDASNILVQPRLAGLPAIAKVTHREWEGKMRAGVESLRKANGAGPNGSAQFR